MRVDPDPKPAKRIVDPGVGHRKVLRNPRCRLCEKPSQSGHHFLPRSLGGDDVEAAVIELCGTGTTGCHGLIEAADREARGKLGQRLRREEIDYAFAKMGPGRAAAFLLRYYNWRPK